MDIVNIASKRYTTKAYDNTKTIPEHDITKLLQVLHLTPSSINSQPWHFFIAGTSASKERITKSTNDSFAFNTPNIINASHVVVLCRLIDYKDENLTKVLDQEYADKRYPTSEARDKAFQARKFFIELHSQQHDIGNWMTAQIYIALGYLLMGASALGIDATPMEGFNAAILDQELGLKEKGLTSTLLVSLGYHSSEDYNAKAPKSRLKKEDVFTFL
ncbi:oxygen-insensitive NAD(P)H nitroreductase [Entomobacter blattae]|uniref:Oxygen-insensitive NAD(P)H nitroreductase n=1 Tax=Entomobacter blattae TaxID=2762277 RepID=A0A7H1NPE6_9PROT|nr:oxygen-insensitive NAD(P)H nitroreductase [Entomobacter blattae]QNT77656.1 Oxygen-insensitive NAD(P)H nitroreductase [Entomobacter blattae]